MDEELRRAAGSAIVAGYPAGEPPSQILDALADDALGGVILFKRNLGEPAEVAAQIERLARASVRTPFIAVDQEGGRVQRLGPPVLQLPPMRVLGDHDAPELTRRAARALGRQLDALGFNVDFAPVLDVDTNPANRVIGDRSFGADAARVTRHGLAFAEGLAEAGLLACGKHFPGHGDTVEDSHHELPTLPHPMERLEAVELPPFRAAVGTVGSLMTAHIVFSALDPDRPATLSPVVLTGLLRGEIGYDGLVFSDDLEMKAIHAHRSVGSAAADALRAGCDLVLVCKTPELIEEARRQLAEEAARDEALRARVLAAAARTRAVRGRLRCRPIGEPAELARRLAEPEAREVAAALAAL